jgi:hypothetical protein
MLLPEGGRPPWDTEVDVDFVPSLLLPTTREDCDNIRRQAALVMLPELPLPTISAWTDGSASGSTRRGGAGAIVEFDGGRQKLHGPAGDHISSFRAECVALRICINHIGVNYLPNLPVRPAEIRICTDSLSALCAMKAGPSAQRHLICGQIWDELQACA